MNTFFEAFVLCLVDFRCHSNRSYLQFTAEEVN